MEMVLRRIFYGECFAENFLWRWFCGEFFMENGFAENFLWRWFCGNFLWRIFYGEYFAENVYPARIQAGDSLVIM